ncbi:ABC transporter substrate-binding protein [Paraburkholderia tropica]|uniref:ABC transporter substrate-binding protein n=1 Tax=Paraburkholderia tropica TaxID=92647 RepID=UPI002AB22DCB|nr:ABC transporter substrate-binding protein [Paraburkholderia tropica]
MKRLSMRWRTCARAWVVLLVAASVACPAVAADDLIVGFTGMGDYAPIFVAKQQGMFKAQGIDPSLKMMSQVASAVASNSAQIGGVTPTVLLQAIDSGLDLVVIAGGSQTTHADRSFGVVVRTGREIRQPKDFEGKTVGVQAIGAFLQVTFRKWLQDKGVDSSKVHFVEVKIPQMNDVLKGGSVDAVVVPNPFMQRIVDSGNGFVGAYYSADLPEGMPAMVYVSTRAWAASHRKEVAAFRAALAQGIAFTQSRPDATRADIGEFIKVPAAVLAKIHWAQLNAQITPAQLGMWNSILTDQHLLRAPIDVSKLFFTP